MLSDQIQFWFHRGIPFREAALTLKLSRLALEGLVGWARVKLEARTRVDEEKGVISVDVGTCTGAALARIFLQLLTCEFGQDGFRVRRPEPSSPPELDAAADPQDGALLLEESR